MALEIRPYREEEAAAFYRVPSIVFGNYAGERPAPEALTLPPQWSLCAFEDGELATTYGAFPLVTQLNGRKARAAGVTFVGTLPQFRRRGHVRKIMEADFKRRYEERQEPLAILTASIAGIYQRYGYAVCTSAVRYTIDPRWINFAPSLPPAARTMARGLEGRAAAAATALSRVLRAPQRPAASRAADVGRTVARHRTMGQSRCPSVRASSPSTRRTASRRATSRGRRGGWSPPSLTARARASASSSATTSGTRPAPTARSGSC